MGKRQPIISDHAVVRYIERVFGVDVDQIRAGMATDDVRSAIALGASSVTIEGIEFRIRTLADGTRQVATVIERERSPFLTRRVPMREHGDLDEAKARY